MHVLHVGGLGSSIVDLRAMLSGALLAGASGVILSHTHPSGDSSPSREDESLTIQAAAAARAVGIRFVDHVVVARGGDFYSFQAHGKLGHGLSDLILAPPSNIRYG